MSALLFSSLPLLWAQAPAGPQELPSRGVSTLLWLLIWGEPTFTDGRWFGAVITWLKVVGLFSLLGWAATWMVIAVKERGTTRRPRTLEAVTLGVGLVLAFLGVLLNVLQATERLPKASLGGVPAGTVVLSAGALVLFLLAEMELWSMIFRRGAPGDRATLVGVHLALAAGLVVGFLLSGIGVVAGPVGAVLQGVRLGATYMGYVVLARVATVLAREVAAVRARRLYAVAWQSVVEASRRMWAPWVVLAVFVVILAFTTWFLNAPRPAEMGRLYVGTLTLLCSLLLTVMVVILAPISLPNDIRAQTIYTVVSKPVRRLELIWGRILGFMAIVTVLLVVFGVVSLVYLQRQVGGAIQATLAAARKAEEAGDIIKARQLREQAEQLGTRMAARVPVKGSLTFLDSKGQPKRRGIDVGQELEFRSHIEGATLSEAIWRYGVVVDPLDVPRNAAEALRPRRTLDRRIPVDLFLVDGTLEEVLNRLTLLRGDLQAAQARRAQGNLQAAESSRLSAEINRMEQEVARLESEYQALKQKADDLEARAAAAEAAGKAGEAESLRAQAQALHSPPVEVQMTFTIYRTTKGVVGAPVAVSLKATNENTGETYTTAFPIREYYTNRQGLPASILVGSRGALTIEVQCLTPTQYVGMAESDLFLLANRGSFAVNFAKGLFGIWLQTLVLAAVGVFAGTFLSWPVALLTTIGVFVAGTALFSVLQLFAMQILQGGGPFESMIRMVSHDNMMSDLAPTVSVVIAKTLDSIIMPVISRLAYLIPNFSRLDVSNTVADGFNVGWPVILGNLLLALAYALPFSIAGYFILKNREVAA